jgi:endonuclease/exonuclease/phosphatase family metal-dependent hydrolase
LAKNQKNKRPWFRTTLYIINILAVFAILCSYLAAYVSPAKFWPLAFMGITYPIFLAINVFFVLLWLLLWKRFVFLSLLAVIAGPGNIMTIYPLRFGSAQERYGMSYKVISYNVHSLYGNTPDNLVPEARSQVTEFLAGEKADLICVQEFYANGEDYLKTLHKFSHSIHLDYYFFTNYREFWQKTKINAIATFSKYPIANQGYFRLEDKSTFGIFTDIVTEGDTIRVYNVHLESIRLGNDDYSFYSQLGDPAADEKNFSQGSRKMIWKLKKAFILRARQVSILISHMKNCHYPILIAGDFNDTPSSYAYRILSKGRQDAFVQAGKEFIGSTYAGRFPAFRIDYMLYGDYFTALKYQKKEVNLSDHYPIITEFSLTH